MFKIVYILLIFALVIYNDGKCPPTIDTCDRGKISFYLFTDLSKPSEELILGDEDSIKNATIIPKGDFKFLIHGYAGARDKPAIMVDLRNEYLKLKKFNILVVDWGLLTLNGCYFDTGVPSVPVVGRCCAEMVNFILQHRPEINEDQFHIITWSLGAHVAARFGIEFRPKIISRITGLDPALPKFEPPFIKPHLILNRNHAKFVDVLHSNIGIVGVYFSNAHYDIYINGGTFQNGCKWNDFLCDHLRAPEVFLESIDPETKSKFIARKCENNGYFIMFRHCNGKSKKRIEVGEYCKPPDDVKDTGTYHVRTNDHPPYARDSDNEIKN